MKRDYATWEEDLTSDRAELHGYEDELIGAVDKVDMFWVVYDANNEAISRHSSKKEAQAACDKILRLRG